MPKIIKKSNSNNQLAIDRKFAKNSYIDLSASEWKILTAVLKELDNDLCNHQTGLYKLLEQLKQGDRSTTTWDIVLTQKSLAEACGVKNKDRQYELFQTALQMAEKTRYNIYIPEAHTYMYLVPFVEIVSIEEDTLMFCVYLPAVFTSILNYESFCLLNIEDTKRLRSGRQFVAYLYFLRIAYRGRIVKHWLSVKQLKEIFGLPINSYVSDRNGVAHFERKDFERAVIIAPIKMINQKTEMKISVRKTRKAIKRNDYVLGYEFSVWLPIKKNQPTPAFETVSEGKILLAPPEITQEEERQVIDPEDMKFPWEYEEEEYAYEEE